ncbi:hypothetical protein ACFQS1_07435 [Paractinoplanes rhizophilus]|uniref:Uncharacterized protein n=1 Tax=Paractinoplanes rhizophilus TaxID=1416877 RepID=A0ABW2HL21_9ACTN
MASRRTIRSEFQQLLLNLAVDVARDVAEEVRPRIANWVTGQAIPTVKSTVVSATTSTRRMATTIGKGRKRAVRVQAKVGPPESEPAVEPAPSEESHDVAAVIEAYRSGLSKVEARRRIVAALAANLSSEQQVQIARDAGIDGDGDTPELDAATITLTQKQLGESIQSMLETTPSLLSEQSLDALREILEAEPA